MINLIGSGISHLENCHSGSLDSESCFFRSPIIFSVNSSLERNSCFRFTSVLIYNFRLFKLSTTFYFLSTLISLGLNKRDRLSFQGGSPSRDQKTYAKKINKGIRNQSAVTRNYEKWQISYMEEVQGVWGWLGLSYKTLSSLHYFCFHMCFFPTQFPPRNPVSSHKHILRSNGTWFQGGFANHKGWCHKTRKIITAQRHTSPVT